MNLLLKLTILSVIICLNVASILHSENKLRIENELNEQEKNITVQKSERQRSNPPQNTKINLQNTITSQENVLQNTDIQSINKNVKSNSQDGDSTSNRTQSDHFNNTNFTVGNSINIFENYGLAALYYKVWPSTPPEAQLLKFSRYETKNIFYSNSIRSKTIKINHSGNNSKYDNYFLIDFCDTTEDLMKAYFSNFNIDGIPEAYKAFSQSFSESRKASIMGISNTFFDNQYSFVLVRLFRRDRKEILQGDKRLRNNLKKDLRQVKMGTRSFPSAFFEKYGTHVITKYEVGDVMFQVCVFGHFYHVLKRSFSLNEFQDELSYMDKFFSLKYALSVGKIKLASGNKDFERLIGDKLYRTTAYFRWYQSIFSIFKEKGLEDTLESLDGEVILGLDLKKLTHVLPKGYERRRLAEFLDNTLLLYYLNL